MKETWDILLLAALAMLGACLARLVQLEGAWQVLQYLAVVGLVAGVSLGTLHW